MPPDDAAPPKQPAAHVALRADPSISELLGFARGIVSDGKVDPEEARALRRWLDANPGATSSFPGRQIAERLAAVFRDGVVDDDECEALRELLDATIGQVAGEDAPARDSYHVSIDEPPVALTFAGQRYAFTGTFYFGSRKECERAVVERGGRCDAEVTSHTDVLVVGTVASRDWAEATHGTKYQRALERRDRGQAIVIVSEEQWVSALGA
jgi:NAD-dependent DNA ligase